MSRPDESASGADATVPPAVREAIADNPEAVARLLRQSGQLAALLDALALVTDAMDDRTVETLAETGTSLGEVADAAADDDVRRGLVRTLEGVGRASAAEPESLGPIGLVGALRDPEVKAGMGYLVAVARGIGAANVADDEGGR
jgi:uncharacterized protein YjgD (DUF1641 family)